VIKIRDQNMIKDQGFGVFGKIDDQKAIKDQVLSVFEKRVVSVI